MLAAAAPALATTVDVVGGTWSYDEGANTARSNFKHTTNQHASSVKIGSQAFKSGCTTRSEWPLASGTKTAACCYDPSC
ncbi:lactococcin 972 family bacteriocin [Streptomyces olivaceoviridis]